MDNETPSTLGQRLRAIRGDEPVGAFMRRAGLDVDQSTYGRWERDATGNPDIRDLAKIAKAGGRSLEWLVSGTDGTGPAMPPADLLELLAPRLDDISRQLEQQAQLLERLARRVELLEQRPS